MAIRATRTLTTVTTSTPVPLDFKQNGFNVGIGVTLTGGTGTYAVEHTFDDIQDATVTPTWFTNAEGATTASQDFNYAFPVTAVRLNLTNVTGATVTMTVLQGSES